MPDRDVFVVKLPRVLVAHPHVSVDANDHAGSPLLRGTKIPVRRLWAWHKKGVTVETLVKRYPGVGWARVLDGLAFAYDNEALIEADLNRERTILNADPHPVPGRMRQTVFPFRGVPQVPQD